MHVRAFLCLFVLAAPAFAAWTDFNVDCRGSGGRVETDRDGNSVCRCESGDEISPPYATCSGVANLNALCFDSGGAMVAPAPAAPQCKCPDGTIVTPGKTKCKSAGKPTPTPTAVPMPPCFESPSAPECVQVPWSRENHLGNGGAPLR